jgi:ComF family protein
MELVRRVGTAILDALFVPRCIGCDAFLRREAPAPYCGSCAAGIQWIHGRVVTPMTRSMPLMAVARFSGPMAETIHHLKYHDRPDIAPALATLIVEGLARTYDAIIPVPLSRRRLRARGYNQSLLIARGVAKALAIPCYPHMLRKTQETAPQVALDHQERLHNLRGVLALHSRHGTRIADRRLLLIDDVATTGATLHECHRILRRVPGVSIAAAVVAIA